MKSKPNNKIIFRDYKALLKIPLLKIRCLQNEIPKNNLRQNANTLIISFVENKIF